MSCDYAVWHTKSHLGNAQAERLYHALCEGDASGVMPSPAIAAFYNEITGLHPELVSVPESQSGKQEQCPWSAAMDRSQGHIIMCCVWSRADYVGDLVHKLARKHGLAMYDPQSEKISYPDDTAPSLLIRLWRALREEQSSQRDPWYVDVSIGLLFLLVAWFAFSGIADFEHGSGHSLLRWLYQLGGVEIAVGLPVLISLGFLFFGARKFVRAG